MIVGLVMQGGRSWAGGAAYVESLAQAVASLEPHERAGVDLRLFYKEEHPSHTLSPDSLASFGGVHAWPRWKRAARKLAERLPVPTEAFDALSEKGVAFAYPHWTERPARGYRSAAWIPDFQHKHLPEFFPAGEIAFRDELYGRVARHARTVVVSSEAAAADFRRFYPGSEANVEKLSSAVAPQDAWYAGDAAAVAARYGLPDRFFAVSNQFWRHKNHALVWEALRILAAREIRPAVVCTGLVDDFRSPGYAEETRRALERGGLAAHVRLLGLVPRADQIQILRRAIAVIQPSLFEGWSGTVEDARALGKTALLSDIPVHREQNPPHAEFFDPKSPQALAASIERHWRNGASGPDLARERAARAQSRERAKEFARRFLRLAGARAA